MLGFSGSYRMCDLLSGMKRASSGGVFMLQKSSGTVRVSPKGEAGPCPKDALQFLHCPSLVSASRPVPD